MVKESACPLQGLCSTPGGKDPTCVTQPKKSVGEHSSLSKLETVIEACFILNVI